MLLSPGDLSHTSILYMEIPVLISHWVYLTFIESENELYDPYNFDILPQYWKPVKYDVVCRLCLMRKNLHEFYKKGVKV
jgi:hypothetical protein